MPPRVIDDSFVIDMTRVAMFSLYPWLHEGVSLIQDDWMIHPGLCGRDFYTPVLIVQIWNGSYGGAGVCVLRNGTFCVFAIIQTRKVWQVPVWMLAVIAGLGIVFVVQI